MSLKTSREHQKTGIKFVSGKGLLRKIGRRWSIEINKVFFMEKWHQRASETFNIERGRDEFGQLEKSRSNGKGCEYMKGTRRITRRLGWLT